MKALAISRMPFKESVSWWLSGAYLVLAALVLYDYLGWTSANFIVGLSTLPFIMQPSRRPGTTHRFALPAVLFAMLCLMIPVKTLFYFSVASALCLCWESTHGRLTLLPAIALALMSPICQYFAQVFSFPIRLWLTNVAGSILVHIGFPARVEGNVITCNTGEYAVDPACMGLNMLVISMLCGLMIVGIYQQKARRQLHSGWVVFLLLCIFGCNVFANLMRMLLLVNFRLLPANPMHGITGIICLVIYVLLPISWGAKMLVRRRGKPIPCDETDLPDSGKPKVRLHLPLIALLLLAAMSIHRRVVAAPEGQLPVVQGYSASWYDKDVIKMQHPNALIYLKPVRGFLYSDHNPLLCWTGSGYKFDSLKQERLAKVPVFSGVLRKDQELLYTAWWYDNGTMRTTSQVGWRWANMRGAKPFTIINITTTSKAALITEIARVTHLQLVH